MLFQKAFRLTFLFTFLIALGCSGGSELSDGGATLFEEDTGVVEDNPILRMGETVEGINPPEEAKKFSGENPTTQSLQEYAETIEVPYEKVLAAWEAYTQQFPNQAPTLDAQDPQKFKSLVENFLLVTDPQLITLRKQIFGTSTSKGLLRTAQESYEGALKDSNFVSHVEAFSKDLNTLTDALSLYVYTILADFNTLGIQVNKINDPDCESTLCKNFNYHAMAIMAASPNHNKFVNTLSPDNNLSWQDHLNEQWARLANFLFLKTSSHTYTFVDFIKSDLAVVEAGLNSGYTFTPQTKQVNTSTPSNTTPTFNAQTLINPNTPNVPLVENASDPEDLEDSPTVKTMNDPEQTSNNEGRQELIENNSTIKIISSDPNEHREEGK